MEKKKLPKAYDSPLRPHFELIKALRRKRKTWKEISQILASEHTLTTSHKTIQNFFRRALHPKRIPMGFEDTEPATARPASAPPPPKPVPDTPKKPGDLAREEYLKNQNEYLKQKAQRTQNEQPPLYLHKPDDQ